MHEKTSACFKKNISIFFRKHQQLFIKKENSPHLLLFFAGWGSDENLFRRTVAEGYDCLLCFDYSLLDGYREIRLLAWSMGVWVAGQILSGLLIPGR